MDEKETWQALINLIEGLSTAQRHMQTELDASRSVIRALLLEWPSDGRSTLAQKIRELATLRDDLSVNSTLSDGERAEYAAAVERLAQLLD